MALWGVWAWLAFALACVFSLFVALLVPGIERRRRLVSMAARGTFVISGVPVEIRGLDNLPTDHCVVVANHASYVDGVLLNGYLPPRIDFVIKGEMRSIPIVHFLLRRAGCKFVERKNAAGSSRDARQLVKLAQQGGSLGFFAEGTFRKEPGVSRFRPGAFVAAIKGDMPVVPIAIAGTRTMLPARRVLPHWTPLTINILPAIAPGDDDYIDSRRLADTSRRRVISVLGEPDLLE